MPKVIHVNFNRPSDAIPGQEDPWEQKDLLIQAVSQLDPEGDTELVNYLLESFIIKKI